MLDLLEMAKLIADRHTSDLFRLETLPSYDAASDDKDFHRYLAGEDAPNAAAKKPWLARLRTDTAAGRRWRRVHAVQLPLSDYLRYECEWGYTYNVANGEDVRIAELATPDDFRRASAFGDFFVIDHRHVVLSHYDDSGRFDGAELLDDHTDAATQCRALAEKLWNTATPFSEWWAAHPEYHRDQQTA